MWAGGLAEWPNRWWWLCPHLTGGAMDGQRRGPKCPSGSEPRRRPLSLPHKQRPPAPSPFRAPPPLAPITARSQSCLRHSLGLGSPGPSPAKCFQLPGGSRCSAPIPLCPRTAPSLPPSPAPHLGTPCFRVFSDISAPLIPTFLGGVGRRRAPSPASGLLEEGPSPPPPQPQPSWYKPPESLPGPSRA